MTSVVFLPKAHFPHCYITSLAGEAADQGTTGRVNTSGLAERVVEVSLLLSSLGLAAGNGVDDTKGEGLHPSHLVSIV